MKASIMQHTLCHCNDSEEIIEKNRKHVERIHKKIRTFLGKQVFNPKGEVNIDIENKGFIDGVQLYEIRVGPPGWKEGYGEPVRVFITSHTPYTSKNKEYFSIETEDHPFLYDKNFKGKTFEEVWDKFVDEHNEALEKWLYQNWKSYIIKT